MHYLSSPMYKEQWTGRAWPSERNRDDDDKRNYNGLARASRLLSASATGAGVLLPQCADYVPHKLIVSCWYTRGGIWLSRSAIIVLLQSEGISAPRFNMNTQLFQSSNLATQQSIHSLYYSVNPGIAALYSSVWSSRVNG